MSTHLDAESIALYADRGFDAPRASEIATHLRECDVCLAEVAEARSARDLAELAGSAARVRRVLSPKLARYLRQKPEKGTGGTGVIAGIATLIGGAAGAIASASASHEMAFGDVRNDEHHASEGVEANAMPDAPHFTTADPVLGTPESDGDYFPGRQSYSDTCAIRCQEFIIRQYTGVDAPEKFFVDEARAHGWYEDGHGTRPGDVGKLLELHGIAVNRYVHANQWHLASELMQGHKVIIGVDSDELWRQNPILTDLRHLFGLGAADHAVVVSGIDTTDPDHVQVIVSDPGTGEAAARYPLEQFVSAWRDSDFFMVATQEPPPAHLELPEMSHFDYGAGHIEHAGGLSWDDFHDAYVTHDDHALERLFDATHAHEHEHADASHHDASLHFDESHDDHPLDSHDVHDIGSHDTFDDDGGDHHHD